MIKIQKTLIVGLGRQGRITVNYFKRRMLALHGDIPVVKLVVIDIPELYDEPQNSVDSEKLAPSELLELSLEEYSVLPQDVYQRYPWLPSGLDQGEEQDWKKTRAAARLALHMQFRPIRNFIEQHFQALGSIDALEKTEELGFSVATERNESSLVIVAGLDDPVGSSMIMDMAYLGQHVYRRAQQQIAGSALLYLPELFTEDSEGEACSYATLKELNAVSVASKYSFDMPDLQVNFVTPPINRGCFLIDMRNEKLNLNNKQEALVLGGEWLLRTLLSPLKVHVDDFMIGQSPVGGMAGESALYSALGFAAYVLPVDELRAWCADRLSYEFIEHHFLARAYFSDAATRLTDFYNETHLRPDTLKNERLKKDALGRPIELPTNRIDQLSLQPLNQIRRYAQDLIKDIVEDVNTNRKPQIERNSKEYYMWLEERLHQEIRDILRQHPIGGVRLALQFARRLRDDLQEFGAALHRREEAYKALNQQLTLDVNRAWPELNRALAGMPSLPIGILAILGGFFAPLILASAWAWQSFSETMPVPGLLIIILAWLLSLGVCYLTIRAFTRGVERVRNQLTVRLKRRYENELELALVQSAGSLYPEFSILINQEISSLEKFVKQLQDLQTRFRSRLKTEPLTGEVEFAMQRSVLTPERVEEIYQTYLGTEGSQAHLKDLTDRAGQLDSLRELDADELEGKLFSFGWIVFQRAEELRVVDLLSQQMPTRTQAEKLLGAALDRARPLLTLDLYSLPQAYGLAEKTVLGIEDNMHEISTRMVSLANDIVRESTGDKHALVLTTLKQGIPLATVDRLDELQKQYLKILRQDSLPIHLTDELALNADPLVSIDHTQIEYPVAFAVGRALGLVKPDEQGVFSINPGGKSPPVVLSNNPLNAAILLGADAELLKKLIEAIQENLDARPNQENLAILQAALEDKAFSEWEKNRIEKFIRLLLG